MRMGGAGWRHRVVATILNNLGNAYEALGNPQMKRELLAEALHIQEREYETEHREVPITLANLGGAHGDLGRR